MDKNWYDKLNVSRVINGKGTSTSVGGSLMPDVVVQAMKQAAQDYVQLDELLEQAGKYIADITDNEACYVCAGSSSGILLAAAACMAKNNDKNIRQLPDTTGMPDEFIVHQSHMNPYVRIVPVAGGKIVPAGYSTKTKPWQIEDAITEETAGILYIFYRGGWRVEEAALSLQETIDIADQHDLPVIVDAAGQIPPRENLWKFTEMGADLVIVSGGKCLRGPQSSGLILGDSELIEACKKLGPPNHNIGRASKVPKEEIVGLVAAVEHYLSTDEDEKLAECESLVDDIVEGLSEIDGIDAYSRFPGDSGEPFSFVEIKLVGQNSVSMRDSLLDDLLDWDPPIVLRPTLRDRISINPITIHEGQDEILVDAISEIMKRLR